MFNVKFRMPNVLLEIIQLQALFPENTYGVDSGGDPKVIPKLTFEEFKVCTLCSLNYFRICPRGWLIFSATMSWIFMTFINLTFVGWLPIEMVFHFLNGCQAWFKWLQGHLHHLGHANLWQKLVAHGSTHTINMHLCVFYVVDLGIN